MFSIVSANRVTYFPTLCHMGKASNLTDGIIVLQDLNCQNIVTGIENAYQRQGQISSDMNICCTDRPICKRKSFFSFYISRNFSTSSKNFIAKVDHRKNYYQVLGVTPKCSDARIKQAYYRLSKVYHPDVNKSKEAVERFHEITEAYEILSNSSLKHTYDSGRRGHSHSVQRGVRPHPVNFNARGPHQYRKVEQYNHAEWFKNHYSDAFKKTQDRKKEKDFMDAMTPPRRAKPGVNINEQQPDKELIYKMIQVLMTLLVLLIVLKLYNIEKKR